MAPTALCGHRSADNVVGFREGMSNFLSGGWGCRPPDPPPPYLRGAPASRGGAAVLQTPLLYYGGLCPPRAPKKVPDDPYNQGQEQKINIKVYVLEAGFDVLPAVAGRRAAVRD